MEDSSSVLHVPQIAQIGQDKSKQFTMNAKLVNNGLAINVRALNDTGAGILASISPKCAKKLAKQTNCNIQPLNKPIVLRDFSQQIRGQVTKSVRATLQIDGRQFPNMRFLIMTQSHDIYLGLDFWTKHKIGLMPATRSLIWPDNLPPLAQFSKPIVVADKKHVPAEVRAAHQADSDRRDALMAEADRATSKSAKRKQILTRPWRRETTVSTVKEETPLTLPSDEDIATAEIAALTAELEADERQARWAKLPMPREPIPLLRPEEEVLSVPINALQAEKKQRSQVYKKSADGKHIPFPEDEDPEHVEAVRQKLPPRLRHLEGFFSKANSKKLPPSRPGHDVHLELSKPIEGQPARYRTPYAYMALEKQTTDELLKIGFIEPCPDMPPHAAATLFVPKKDSPEKRFCCDYRFINKFLKKRVVLAPDVPGTIARVGRAKRVSKIDIIRAFNRMLVRVNDRYLTAFTTRQGTFQWKVLPFGLSVGPAWFQALVNAALNELLDAIASAYADDVLIFTEDDDEEAHYEDVEEVIYRLHKAHLQGDIKKSAFNVTETSYLGMVLSIEEGVKIDPAKVKAITDWKWEDINSKSAIRSFIGLCNYIRVFCHHASEVLEPLNRLLKKDAEFVKGPEQLAAFEAMKKLATSNPVLAFYQPGRPIKVECDASGKATGGVIWQQQKDETWKPIGFSSKTMTPTEQAYPIQDQELLAVIHSLQDNEQALWGTEFVVLTDHHALVYFNSKRLLSTRQIRWSQYLANFDITWRYRPGKENVAADALSRKTADNPTVRARERVERTRALIPANHKVIAAVEADGDAPQGFELADLVVIENEAQGLGKHDGKVIVPETTADGKTFLRTALIREVHGPKIYGHGGVNKTVKHLQPYWFWEQMKKTVGQYIRNCRECQRNKARHDKTPGLLQPLEIPTLVWQTVIVDGKSMPKDDDGYDYVWCFICKFSRLIIRIPGKKTDDAETLAKRYYNRIYSLFGLPQIWISDNAGPFISEFMETMNTLTDTKHRHGSSRHPQTQGAIERTNADLDQAMRFYIDKYQKNWRKHLPALDYAHNAADHESLGMPPLKVALGTMPRHPLTLQLRDVDVSTERRLQAAKLAHQIQEVQKMAVERAKETRARYEAQANKKRRPVDFGVEDYVYVSKKGMATDAPTTKLDSQWCGPWRIAKEIHGSFELDTPEWYKGSKLFHADRLRKAATDPLPQQIKVPEPPEVINNEPEWEVERILASRLTGRNRKLQYQASWVGHDDDPTYYDASGFKNASTKLEAFHLEYPKAAGPPVNLPHWIREAASEQELPYDRNLDNVAVHAGLDDFASRRNARRH